MKKLKKLSSVVVSLLLVLGMLTPSFAIPSYAATTPSLSIDSKTVNQGEEFTVAVKIQNAANSVYNGNFTLQYDNSKLETVSYTYGGIFNDHTKNCNLDYQSKGNQIRFTFSGAYALKQDGTLVTFTFRAKSSVSGTSNLQFTAYKLYDENGISLGGTANGSTITISPNPAITPQLSLTGGTVEAGKTITVPINISNSAGVYNGNFTLQYDSSLLTAESYTYGTIFNDHTKNCNLNYQSTGNQIRFTFSGAYALKQDGTLVSITFKAKENVSGTAALQFTAYKMYDENGVSIDTTVSNGNITVTPKPVKTLTSISIQTNPTKTTYYIGEALDISGLTLRLTYSDGSTETVSSGFTTSGFSSSSAGTKTVTVTYEGKTTTFDITVNDTSSTIIAEGTCKYSLIWTLDSNGLLTIKKSSPNNSGSMYDYSYNDFPWAQYRYEIKAIEVLDGVTCISKCAFERCINLTTVSIPSSVTTIGAQAFQACTKLTSVTILGSNTTIENFAFMSCTSLNSLTLSDGLIEIGSQAFDNCTGLTSLFIPKSVKSISGNAFLRCTGLETINVDSENSVYHSEGNCIIKTSNKWLLLGCKNSVIPSNGSVVLLEELAFQDCIGLTSITIPEGIEEIGYRTFNGCINLTSITIPKSVTKIGEYAFTGCDNLTIYGYNDSAARVYAINNNKKFIALDAAELVSVSVASQPSKQTYYISDTLDTNGLQLRLTYSDGSTETVSSGYTTSGFSSTSAGTKTVTVTYEGKTTTFTATVNTPSISLSSTSKSMTVGDTAALTATTTPSGQAVTWTSSNTNVATVSGGTVTAKSAGSATITAKFTYNGITYSKTCSVTVTSAPNPKPTLSSISIATQPTKITYEIGESLNTSGLTLKLTYSDGSTKTVSSGFTTSGFSSATSGTKTVTVSYGGKTTSFTVTVKAAPTVIGESDPQMVIDSKTARRGDTVTLSLELKNVSELKSIALSGITYDSSALELISGEWKISDSILQNWNPANQTAAIAFVSNSDVNGIIFTLTFKVKDGTEDGSYSVGCTVTAKTKTASGAEENVTIPTVCGSIEVISVIRGDVNGDNLVTSDDAILVLYYTLLPEMYTVNQDVDFDGDGLITSDDAIYLLYYTLLPDLYPLN